MTVSFILLAIAVVLFLAKKNNLITNETIQTWANIAGILSLIFAVLVFVSPSLESIQWPRLQPGGSNPLETPTFEAEKLDPDSLSEPTPTVTAFSADYSDDDSFLRGEITGEYEIHPEFILVIIRGGNLSVSPNNNYSFSGLVTIEEITAGLFTLDENLTSNDRFSFNRSDDIISVIDNDELYQVPEIQFKFDREPSVDYSKVWLGFTIKSAFSDDNQNHVYSLIEDKDFLFLGQ